MKILFFIDKIGGGGRERRMAQLVCELDKREDIEMMAVTTSDEIGYKEISNTSLKIKIVNNSSHRERLRLYTNIVREFLPNIIHLWIETPMYCVLLPRLARKYNCKYLAGFVADSNPLKNWTLNTLAIRYTFYCADAIVSNSRAGLLSKKSPLKKSYVVNNGFDFSRFNSIIDRESKRQELGVSNIFLVTMAARVNRAKDWMSFINLAEMAAKDSLNVYFLAVGDGNQLPYYQKEVIKHQLTNVRFVGHRSDVEEIWQITDMSVLFTSEIHSEGISNSIMEAMAAGVPVIATKGGGTAEIIQDGENGFIVPLHGVKEAYRILNNLLVNEEKRKFIGSTAQKHIQDNFQLSKMGDEYLGLYKKLMQR